MLKRRVKKMSATTADERATTGRTGMRADGMIMIDAAVGAMMMIDAAAVVTITGNATVAETTTGNPDTIDTATTITSVETPVDPGLLMTVAGAQSTIDVLLLQRGISEMGALNHQGELMIAVPDRLLLEYKMIVVAPDHLAGTSTTGVALALRIGITQLRGRFVLAVPLPSPQSRRRAPRRSSPECKQMRMRSRRNAWSVSASGK